MKYIEEFKEGDRIGDIYLCKFKQSALTKSGKSYENVILQDKTGTIDSKIWDPASAGIEDFDALDYVYVVGDVTSFQGALQLSVKRVRRVSEGEYDPRDYLPVSRYDVEGMYEKVLGYIQTLKNPYLKKLAESFFVENEGFVRVFKAHSAAKSVHHGFVGGLLEHTLSVTELCDYYASHYDFLNRDLLISAALFHDIGKTKELSDFPENDYTDDGQLLGHIVIGVELVGLGIRRIPNFPKKLASELKHCIVSHHGELEYGSPKKPALAEAVALSFADCTDARMETFREILEGAPGREDWLGFNRFVDSNVRRTSNFSER